MRIRIPCILLSILFSACQQKLPADLAALDDQLPEVIDINFHVRPILSDRCYACHGPDEKKREAGLRLDLPEGIFGTNHDSGAPVIRAGKPFRSPLVKRILHHDAEELMPPPQSRLSLSQREKAILIKWIEQGATWKDHWAFIPAERPPLSLEAQDTSIHSPIDQLVLDRLELEDLHFSPDASRENLVRRLSFDLIGIPPTIDELDAFLSDTSTDAYEKLVDRLLSSKHYGERMATDWLDIARYADSHGYQDDGYRFVWPWRDWVIEAFNDNMGYDQFVLNQLAGDVIPDATKEQKLATTFLRNHRINSELGIPEEEYRVEYVADRTNTFGSAMLGMTLECARCHDHKYDPISQKEYYQLFAFFNNVNEMGEIANEGNPGPLMRLTNDEVEQRLQWLSHQLDIQQKKLAAKKQTSIGEFLPSSGEIKESLQRELLVHYSFESMGNTYIPNLATNGKPAKIKEAIQRVNGKIGQGIQLEEYQTIKMGQETKMDRTDAFSVALWIKPIQRGSYVPIWGDAGGKNIDFRGTEMALDHQKVSVRVCHALPHNYLQITTKDTVALDQWVHIVVRYDGSSEAKGIEVFVNGQAAPATILHDRLYKFSALNGMRLGGETRWGSFGGEQLDEVRVYKRVLSQLEIEALYDPEILDVGDWTDLNAEKIAEYYFMFRDQGVARIRETIDSLRRELSQVQDTIQEIMVMEEMPKVRSTFVLNRGLYDSPMDQVETGTPAIFPEARDRSDRKSRLDLANWLLHPEHPLTARVAVNRLWKQVFGQGLVASMADFGSQGNLPTHPELLDYLAVEFVESGWDIKALLKQIVMSRTYRQTSAAPDSLLDMDPENLLLARGPRFRLSAEMLRDNALTASGLLVRTMGGPPVKPYQPQGLWKELAAIPNSISSYKQDHGDALYRRSLYNFWKRSSPPPALMAFDAPTRELCEVERQRTMTPLQSLVLWNDPQWLEAARLIGERMMTETSDLDAQIRLAFRLLTSRRPGEFELQRLKEFYRSQHHKYQTKPEAATQLLAIGEYPHKTGLEISQLAACTMVAHTILNMNEAIIRQ
ncbi:MAG: DUF1553 domain-containing protein [Bacteroidota bacterium]